MTCLRILNHLVVLTVVASVHLACQPTNTPVSAVSDSSFNDQEFVAATAGQDRRIAYYTVSQSDQARYDGSRGAEIATYAASSASSNDSVSVRGIMSPVRDQGSRGTCSVFAAVALVEAETSLDISEQCLARFSSNRDPGHISQRLSYLIQAGGFLEDDCPYSNSRDQIPAGLSDDLKFSAAPAIEMLPHTDLNSLELMKDRLRAGEPVGVAVYLTSMEWFNDGPTRIYKPDESENICSGEEKCPAHAIVVTGFNDQEQMLEFKNSWSSDWKDNGYGKMSYDYFLNFYLDGQANQMVVYH